MTNPQPTTQSRKQEQIALAFQNLNDSCSAVMQIALTDHGIKKMYEAICDTNSAVGRILGLLRDEEMDCEDRVLARVREFYADEQHRVATGEIAETGFSL